MLGHREAFFGGAAGPGKSEALLQGAVMYYDVPTYHAIIFRRTIQSLELEGGLIPRSKEWWLEKPNANGEIAKWNGSKLTWTFPSGATVGFGYMNHKDDHFRYGSTEYQYIAFDEVTEFQEFQYRFMFSRLRLTRDLSEIYGVEPKVRSAANPIGPGVVWVKRRFNLPYGCRERPFIPARLSDNADNVDVELYMESLNQLDPITRERLMNGDWSIQDPGRMFHRDWFVSENHPSLERPLSPLYAVVRYWDLAATAPAMGRDPDYSCGVLMGKDEQERVYILDVRRFQAPPPVVEDRVIQASVEDRARFPDVEYEVWMEQEPGSAGVNTISYYSRNIMQGFYFQGHKTTGSKELRAKPFSSYAANGNIYLLNGLWQTDLLDELEAFPYGEHDDQVDACSGAFQKLARFSLGGPEVSTAKRPY